MSQDMHLDAFGEWLTSRQLPAAYVERYRVEAARFVNSRQGAAPEDLRAAHEDAYIESLRAAGASEQTRANIAGVCMNYRKFLVRTGRSQASDFGGPPAQTAAAASAAASAAAEPAPAPAPEAATSDAFGATGAAPAIAAPALGSSEDAALDSLAHSMTIDPSGTFDTSLAHEPGAGAAPRSSFRAGPSTGPAPAPPTFSEVDFSDPSVAVIAGAAAATEEKDPNNDSWMHPSDAMLGGADAFGPKARSFGGTSALEATPERPGAGELAGFGGDSATNDDSGVSFGGFADVDDEPFGASAPEDDASAEAFAPNDDPFAPSNDPFASGGAGTIAPTSLGGSAADAFAEARKRKAAGADAETSAQSSSGFGLSGENESSDGGLPNFGGWSPKNEAAAPAQSAGQAFRSADAPSARANHQATSVASLLGENDASRDRPAPTGGANPAALKIAVAILALLIVVVVLALVAEITGG